jgi:membrane protease YdiL (CAAX protease family)
MVRFVALAFGISWLIWSPLLAGRESLILYYAGVIGPAIAAFFCAPREVLIRRITRWRVPLVWYAVAIALPFAIRFLADPSPPLFRPPDTIARVTLLMIVLVPFEEIGWRGFALPTLQQRYSPLVASLIVGVIWGLWHLPLAWATIGHQQSENPSRYMIRFIVTILPLSCLATWLFNRSGESIAVASLFHIAINMADFIVVVDERAGGRILWTTTAIATVVTVILYSFPRRGLSKTS